MIRYSIKVSNDHQSLKEVFEADTLLLDALDPALSSQIRGVIDKFNAPVDEVKITASMVA